MAKSTVQPAQVIEEKKEGENAQQPQIDPALIEKLLGQINTLQNRLSEIEEKSNKTGLRESEPKKFGEIGLGKKIPDYDKVEKPVTFIMMGRGYSLSAYNQDGSEIHAPYNVPIVFKWRNSDVRRTPDGDQAIHFSTYTAWSKKEVEFIKNSPYYNYLIFDSITGLNKVNIDLVSGIERATTFVSNMTQEQLFASAQSYGLDVNMGIGKLKSSIIAAKIQEIVDSDNAQYNRMISNVALAPNE